jgi:hypothetical protein
MDIMDSKTERYLEELFKLTEGKIDSTVSMFDIGAVMGLERDAARRTAEDLIAEGLVEIKTLSGAIGITPQGIDLAQSMGCVETAAGLTLGTAPLLEESGRRALDTVLNAIKEHLSKAPIAFDRLEEIIIDIKTIEVQLLSNRPKTAIIRTVLDSLKEALHAAGAATLAEDLNKMIGN